MNQNTIESIGAIIIKIAYDNENFACDRCLKTAADLFEILNNYANVEYCNGIAEQWKHIIDCDINDWRLL